MRGLTLFPVLLLSSLSFGASLTVGDAAPTFKTQTMLKGHAVDLSKGLHVVEFWATWCGPCKMNIPHLTEMAHKHQGKVEVTGVDVWENGDDKIGQARKFVDSMGDKMDYNIAFDGDAKAMDAAYMQAGGTGGIPTAFLVKDGKVLDIEIGYPMTGLDKAIDQVLAGEFDLAAAKAKHEKRMAMQAEQRKQMLLLAPARTAERKGDYAGAVAAFDKVKTDDPGLKIQVTMGRFDALTHVGGPRLVEAAKAILASDLGKGGETRLMAKAVLGGPAVTDEAKTFLASPSGKDAMQLNSVAWFMVDPTLKLPNPNYEAALMLAEAAAKASEMKDPSILDTYGLALFKAGRTKEAMDVQTKAVALAQAQSMDAASLKDLQAHLDEFQKAAVAKTRG